MSNQITPENYAHLIDAYILSALDDGLEVVLSEVGGTHDEPPALIIKLPRFGIVGGRIEYIGDGNGD